MKLEVNMYRLADAMDVKTQERADAVFQSLVSEQWMKGGSLGEAMKIVKSNLGYYAGYYDDETRRRVERLYRCVHPIFGSIEQNGPPTPEQAFSAGVAIGQGGSLHRYEQPVDEPPKPPKIRAIEV